MKFEKYVFGVVLAFGFAAWMASPAMAHNVFKQQVSKKYADLKVSCNACHVQGEEKSTRNPFGQLIHNELKDLELTKNWKAIKDKDEKKKYETDVMAPAFDKAFKKISTMTYDDMIKAGMVAGFDKSDSKDKD